MYVADSLKIGEKENPRLSALWNKQERSKARKRAMALLITIVSNLMRFLQI